MSRSVSVDLWDTLLRRRCHPDEVKLFTARLIYLRFYHLLQAKYQSPAALLRERIRQERAIGAQRRLAGDDDEYSIQEVLHFLLRHIVKPGKWLPENALQDILLVEQHHERAVSYEDSGISRFLEKHPADSRYIVSDFYMGRQFCSDLLAEKSPWLAPVRLYISCDHGVNKRSGRLLEKLLASENIRADHHTHIGDSKKSDVQVPSRLGMHAILYDHVKEDKMRDQNNRRFNNRFRSIRPYVDELMLRLNGTAPCAHAKTAEQEELFCIGRSSALIFHGLILQAIETALKESIDIMYYISREGLFFKKIHERISSPDLLGIPVPAAEHLEVSRLSTFLPSLRSVSCDELMRLWHFYATQSPRAFLSSLGVDLSAFLPMIKRHNLNPDTDIQKPWENACLHSFIADPQVQAMLHEMQIERRSGLTAYLSEKGITLQSKKVLFVDIGWKGTIQDNLAYLFPGTQFYGVYLALQKFAGPQPSNVIKEAFGRNENLACGGRSAAVRCIAPWELLCTSGEGSAAFYEAVNGHAAVRREYNEAEQKMHAQKTHFFQEGVLSASPHIADWISTYAITAAELRSHCLRAMADLSADPPMALINLFFSSERNETFGLGRHVSMMPPPPGELVRQALSTARCFKDVKMLLIRTRWPFGYLKLHGLNRLLRLFKDPFP